MSKLPPEQSTQYHWLSLWLVNHMRASLHAIGDLIQSPLASLMTLAVIGIALALPTGLIVILNNIQQLTQHWRGQPSISLYLKNNLPSNQIKQLTQTLERQPHIHHIQLISPQQGLSELAHNKQFKQAMSALPHNPLPPVIVVTPNTDTTSPHAMQRLRHKLQQYPQVHLTQLDLTWVKRLYYFIELGKRLLYTMAILFSLGVVLIIGNTIRLTTQSHQYEMQVLKLIGASHSFIRRPLLYRGFFFGLLSGALTWLIVTACLHWLTSPVQHLLSSYGSSSASLSLSLHASLAIFVSAIVLGLIGAWFATRRHLTAPEYL